MDIKTPVTFKQDQEIAKVEIGFNFAQATGKVTVGVRAFDSEGRPCRFDPTLLHRTSDLENFAFFTGKSKEGETIQEFAERLAAPYLERVYGIK